MKCTFHSHSGQYCKHGYGLLSEVIESALSRNFVKLGLSEHQPRNEIQDLYPEEIELNLTNKDLHNMFDEYVKEARQIQQQQKSIEILVGMESEYIRDSCLDTCLSLVKKHNLDFIVGSLHHVHEIPIDFSESLYNKAEELSKGTEQLFCDYFDAQFKMIETLKPLIIGHFDLIRIFRHDFVIKEGTQLWTKICRNVDLVVSYGAIFEINSRAYKKNMSDPYPCSIILKYMIKVGAKFTLSDDSHGPDDLGMHYDKALKYIKDNGIITLYCLKRKDLTKPTTIEVFIDNL